VQPHVDALDVEQVLARRQLPHHLAALDVLEAHRARLAACRCRPGLELEVAAGAGAGVSNKAKLVGERRQRIDRGLGQPEPALRPRCGSCCCIRDVARAVAAAAGLPCEAAGDAEGDQCQSAEQERHPDADGDGQGAEQEQRHRARRDAIVRAAVSTSPTAAGVALAAAVAAAAAGPRGEQGRHDRSKLDRLVEVPVRTPM